MGAAGFGQAFRTISRFSTPLRGVCASTNPCNSGLRPAKPAVPGSCPALRAVSRFLPGALRAPGGLPHVGSDAGRNPWN